MCEVKHVQSHICKYYGVEKDTEKASYLIDYIIQKMHRVFRYMISTGTIQYQYFSIMWLSKLLIYLAI